MSIDLSAPSNDTYGLAKQYLAAYELLDDDEVPEGVDPRFLDPEGVESQIVQLVAQIIDAGKRYYPVSAYPAFSADELRLAWSLFSSNLGLNPRATRALRRAAATGVDPRA